jgi:hypothetical protein
VDLLRRGYWTALILAQRRSIREEHVTNYRCVASLADLLFTYF